MSAPLFLTHADPTAQHASTLAHTQTGDHVFSTLDDGVPFLLALLFVTLRTETAALRFCVIFAQPSLLRTGRRRFKLVKVQLDTIPYAMRHVPCGLAVVSILADNANYWGFCSPSFHLYLIKHPLRAAVVSKLRFIPNGGALMRHDDVVEQCKMWEARVMGLAGRYGMYWFLMGTSHLPALGARKQCPWGTRMESL
ncbi:hypothetical protein B0H10DRAFT_2217606 [Mycena sp. CBHHK59/15]|nr:hypothetical protein B0H10DRAFT_2217606 [Mycena sp. CBHHK59/15]